MKLVQVLIALTLTLVLSGCGLVSNIIGEREIANPFGIDNQRVAIPLTSESGLSVQAEGEQGTSFTFSDQEFNLRGFGGDYIKSEIGFAPEASVSKPIVGTYPLSFTITDMTMTLALSDEGADGGRAITTTSTLSGALTFRQAANCGNLEVSCTYTYDEASGVILASALLLELGTTRDTDADLKEAIRIIQLDGENTPNTATLTFSVMVDSAPDLAGSILNLTLKEGKSVVKL